MKFLGNFFYNENKFVNINKKFTLNEKEIIKFLLNKFKLFNLILKYKK